MKILTVAVLCSLLCSAKAMASEECVKSHAASLQACVDARSAALFKLKSLAESLAVKKQKAMTEEGFHVCVANANAADAACSKTYAVRKEKGTKQNGGGATTTSIKTQSGKKNF